MRAPGVHRRGAETRHDIGRESVGEVALLGGALLFQYFSNDRLGGKKKTEIMRYGESSSLC